MEKKKEKVVKMEEINAEAPEIMEEEDSENEGRSVEECLTIENEKLISENEALTKENQELTETVQRQQAEFDNYRRRTLKEKEELSLVAVGDLVACILPVLDNFERALACGAEKGLAEGVEMVRNQLLSLLSETGLKPLGTKGEAFDPKLHDALLQEEVPDAEKDTILEVMQKGYALGDRLLRPAMVKVAK